jgi:dTDP-4-dehydrorhamnose reductase
VKIFVTGSKGQLGTDCLGLLADEHTVLGMDLPEMDITDAESVRTRLDAFGPDAIVNCAAYTDVDGSESHPDVAWSVNAEGPRIVGEWAARAGARLIHISTDYVFDGLRAPPNPYVESDEPNPQSAYGRGKRAGEEAVQRTGADHIILRTAWLYGRTGRNFPKTILRLATSGTARPLRVVNDQHGSPTWSYRLAEQIGAVLTSKLTGICHATAEGHCTWFEFASRLLARIGIETAVFPCTTSEYPRPARRPANSILENARLKSAGLNVMIDWRTDLDTFVERHRRDLLAEV